MCFPKNKKKMSKQSNYHSFFFKCPHMFRMSRTNFFTSLRWSSSTKCVKWFFRLNPIFSVLSDKFLIDLLIVKLVVKETTSKKKKKKNLTFTAGGSFFSTECTESVNAIALNLDNTSSCLSFIKLIIQYPLHSKKKKKNSKILKNWEKNCRKS